MALPETNLTLIARMKDPVDQRAWQEFVGAYEPFLLRMLSRHVLWIQTPAIYRSRYFRRSAGH